MSAGRIFTIILIIIYSFSEIAHGENPSSTRVTSRKIFKLIYNFEFSEAESLLSQCNMNETEKEILATDLLWWKLIAEPNGDHIEQFMDLLDQRKNASQFWETDEGRLVYRSYKVRYDLACNRYFSAFFDYASLKKLTQNNQFGKSAGNYEINQLLELYQSFLTLLENYYLRQNISKRSRQLLVSQLNSIEQNCNSGDVITRTLSHYFLFKFYMETGYDKGKAIEHSVALHTMYPENYIFKLDNVISNDQ